MVFVIVQIKCDVKVLKSWYVCVFVDSSTLSDLYKEFSGGQLGGTQSMVHNYYEKVITALIT